jgi:peptide/nickel transport system permease protein
MTALPNAIEVEAAATEVTAAPQAPRFLKRLVRRKLAVVCLVFLGVLAFVGTFAPIIYPHVSQELAGDLLSAREGPSWAHPLGTDQLGRDVLKRLLVGTRPVIVGVAEAVIVGLMIGTALGLIAGYFGGRIDRVVGRCTDLMFALPGLVIVLVVLSVFPQNMLAAMTTLGVLFAPSVARVVRSAVLPVANELYVSAARVSGLSHPRIIFRHVLSRVSGVVIIQASLLAIAALLAQSGLAFLGLLTNPPAPSWGGMIDDGFNVIVQDPWLIWPPGIAIGLTVLALSQLGDLVRDASTEAWLMPAGRERRKRSTRTAAPVVSDAQGTRSKLIVVPTPAAPSVLASTQALLSVQRLSVSFASPVGRRATVVDDVSFDIRPGETVGVVGESGCGKTATALAILGLLPGTGRVEAGEIFFAGRNLTSLSDRAMHSVRGSSIAMISQEPMVSFDPTFRIGRQLAEVARRHLHLSRRDANDHVLGLLQQVHLPDPEAVARLYPHELSGGMAQRASVARALAGEPKLLIADEPTTALDVTVQAEILELLREVQRDRGMSILLVTHDWGVVADSCERVVVMYAGQIVERAELEPMFRSPLHPYTEALLAANPRHQSARGLALPSIPGAVPQPGNWPTGCHFQPRCRYATAACGERPVPLASVGPNRESRCIHREQLRAHR